MLRVAICDDDELSLKDTAKKFTQSCMDHAPEITLFLGGRELIRAVEENGYQPDVLLLDIVLENDINGIDIAKRINLLCPRCGIIFITSFISYAPDVYETRHSYFILKSQFEERINSALAKAVADAGSKKCIAFNERNKTIVLSAYEVLYLERNLKKTSIYLDSGKKYETYLKPVDILKDLNNEMFVQCHQSFFVNMEAVLAMETDSFLLNNGRRIPVSKSRRKETKEIFHAFVRRSVSRDADSSIL